ncbi:hypothetical protein V2J09_016257 [Rumex salicifolius]
MNFYFSCQSFKHAKLVFNTIDHPHDITLWNGFLAALTKNFLFHNALEFFELLLKNPCLKPDDFTYPSVLKACGGLGRVVYGNLVHALVIKSGLLSDVVIASSTVGMYAKCSVFESAVKLFDEITERDVACWNVVISCYYQDGQFEKALELYEQMKGYGFRPDSVTLTTIISSSARLLDLERGKQIHSELLLNGFVLDGFVSSALVDMYGKCGCLETAIELFKQIPRKTVVTWNSMISGYSLKGDSKSCVELFRRMTGEGIRPTLTTLGSLLTACSRSASLHHGLFLHGYMVRNSIEPDVFFNSVLVDFYFKCGHTRSAENVFRFMPKANAISWNVMISGYVTLGSYHNAINTYREMREAMMKPDPVTLTSVLSACSQLAAVDLGEEVHGCISENKFETNEVVMGALLDMYAKCGAMEEALSVFNQLPERDVVSWTSMIAAYGSHGQAFEAVKLFERMKRSGVRPDRVTFLALLSACSHGGLVDEGLSYFRQMETHYGIQPTVELYSCLIDLLGRAGRLQEAYDILRKEPGIRHEPQLLSTLFSACHLHGELHLGEEVAKQLLETCREDPSTYVILANLYASLEQWDMAKQVRLKIRDLKLRKTPGCSWIEIDKKIQMFLVEDKSHLCKESIYDCLAILLYHMERAEVVDLEID